MAAFYSLVPNLDQLIIVKLSMFLLLILSGQLLSQSNQISITGQIIDATDGYPISYSRITWDTLEAGTLSEVDGTFVLPVPKTSGLPKKLYVLSIGYQTNVILIERLGANRNITIKLEQLVFAPILVQASKISRRGILTPSVERLRNVPVASGQADIIKSLTIYPGISGGQEGLSALHVRGGNDDQNYYLLDGTTIYNPGHLFGFLSVFNPNIVGSVDVYKDYIPSRLAHRLSSTIEVTTRDGSSGKRLRSREIGLLGFSYTDEGSFRDTTFTYAGGIRLSHTAALTLGTLPGYLSKKKSPLLFAGMYDINFKLRKQLSKYKYLTAAVYLGDDLYGGTVRQQDDNGSTGESSSLLRYGNRSLSFSYIGKSPSGNQHTTRINAGGFRNNYRLKEVQGRQPDTDETLYKNQSALDEISVQHYRSYGGLRQSLSIGVSANHRYIEPARIEIEEDGEKRLLPRTGRQTTEAALFVDGLLDIGADVTLRSGLKATGLYLHEGNVSKQALSYHMYVERTVGRGYVSAGYRRTNQLIHSVELASGGLPIRVWIPVSKRLPIENDHTFSLSYDRSVSNGRRLTTSLYYRHFRNQVFLPERSLSISNNTDWEQSILSRGTGRSYGIEFYYEQPLTGWLLTSLSYTYSRSFRQFADFNLGREFSYDYDRPHDLYLSLNWELKKRWSIVSAFALASGIPFSQPTANALDFSGDIRPVIQDYNNGRFIPYHRLDVLLTRERTTQRGKKALLKFGLYNIYGRRNPLFFSYGLRGSGRVDLLTGTSTVQYRDDFRFGTLFTFFPMISYEVRY